MLNKRKSMSYNRHKATGIEKANLYMPDRCKRFQNVPNVILKSRKYFSGHLCLQENITE